LRQWQLQEAKARLSEVVRASEEAGPQEITLRGKAVAVVMARAEFERLSAKAGSFVEFLTGSPLAGVELEVRGGKTAARRAKA
jgi:prevent-host-death family protein